VRYLAPRGEVFRGGMSHDLASGALTARERDGTAIAYYNGRGGFLWPQTDQLRGFHQVLRHFPLAAVNGIWSLDLGGPPAQGR
jgi:hypothetical protein